jgi:hypothetical protein
MSLWPDTRARKACAGRGISRNSKESISAHKGLFRRRPFATSIVFQVVFVEHAQLRRAKHAQGDCVKIIRGIALHPLRVSRPPVAELLDHRRRTPCPGVALPLLRVVVYRCPLPATELLDPRPSFPTDMLKRVLSCFALAGHQKDRFSLGNGTTSAVASAVCRGRGTEPWPSEKCDPHQWWKTARTIALLRAVRKTHH